MDPSLPLPYGASLPDCARQHVSLGESSRLGLIERAGRVVLFHELAQWYVDRQWRLPNGEPFGFGGDIGETTLMRMKSSCHECSRRYHVIADLSESI